MKFKKFLSQVQVFFYRTRYFWNKLGLTLLTLFLTIVVSFVLIKSLPGDVVYNYALSLQGSLKISYDEAYKLAVRLINYDPQQNIVSSFLTYLKGFFSGNLGQSIYLDTVNANSIIKQYLPWTLLVSSISLFLSFFIGTKIGIKMARKREGATDTIYTSIITITSSIPDYLLGIILLMYLGSTLGLFPTYGAADLSSKKYFWSYLLSILHHAALPIITYTIAQIGNWALLAKGSTVAVLGDDYVNAAIARGLPKRVIDRKYLQKNAMLPLITSLVISFAYLFGGSAVMESVFSYPGIGKAFTMYIGQRDYFVVQGLFVFLSFLIIIANLLADFICGLLDPRIRNK
jgi:peptide/nickel transport system permease protein